MKGLLFVIFCTGFHCSWGQLTDFSKISATALRSVKFDTTYFDNGQIETITRQSWFVPTSKQRFKEREVKTVYQYDKCGHWRNTTTVFEAFGTMRWEEDNLAIGVSCDVPWIKPLIL